MEKVRVPKYVAKFIELRKEDGDLERIVKSYNYFSRSLGNLNSEHLVYPEAIEWYVENPYEFIRAFVEGYDVEEKKYLWRKKKEHLASFEDDLYLYIVKTFTGTTKHIAPHQRYSECEVTSHLGVKDFEMFEKVED